MEVSNNELLLKIKKLNKKISSLEERKNKLEDEKKHNEMQIKFMGIMILIAEIISCISFCPIIGPICIPMFLFAFTSSYYISFKMFREQKQLLNAYIKNIDDQIYDNKIEKRTKESQLYILSKSDNLTKFSPIQNQNSNNLYSNNLKQLKKPETLKKERTKVKR